MRAGITGHQHIGQEETVAWVVENLSEVVAQYRIDHGFTSLAIGADQLFAQILLQRGVAYEAVLPCREIERTFQSQEDLKTYRYLLRNAAAIETLDFIEPADTAFLEAGKRVVDLSDIVIAVWNGLPAQSLGGTAAAVKYALDREKRVLHIHSVDRRITEITRMD